MSIKIKTISTVQLPPPKCRKNLFHVVLTPGWAWSGTRSGLFSFLKLFSPRWDVLQVLHMESRSRTRTHVGECAFSFYPALIQMFFHSIPWVEPETECVSGSLFYPDPEYGVAI